MKYFGNYRGIIFRRDHPEGAGMVKVWVPSVHREIYKSDIDRIDGENSNVDYKIEQFSSNVVDFISEQIPWCEIAQPLIGGGGSNYTYGGSKSYGDGYPGYNGTIPVDENGNVHPEDVRAYFVGAIKNSSLNGLVPNDGPNFNVDGSPESWANFFVTLCEKESSFNTGTIGDKNRPDIPGASHGLFQLSPEDGNNKRYNPSGSPYTLEQLKDPKFNIDTTIRIAEVLLSDDNVIAGGDSRGLSRYWGPLRRGQVNPPPVPDTPTPPVSNKQTQSPVSALTSSPSDGTLSNNSGVQVFVGSRNDLKAKNGSFISNRFERKISLDFNAASGNAKGFEVILPSDATDIEIERAEQYLEELDIFFKRGGLSRENRGVKTKNFPSSNPVIFTEPFFNTDTDAINYVIQNIGEYNNILLRTLGQIPFSTLIAPHENTQISDTVGGDRNGAVLNYNGETIGEREFAMRYILRPLSNGKGVDYHDGFYSVGNKHPEEIRDTEFLKDLGVSDSDIEKTVELGKSIFEQKKTLKVEPTKENAETLRSLKQERDEFWDNLEVTESDEKLKIEKTAKLKEYVNTKDLDYTPKPVNNNVNPASYTLNHSNYDGVTRGSFTIPDVGAKVWVFFEGGDMDFPVVFANNPSPRDYAGIYEITSESPDYPVDNDSGDETPITRGKQVINSRGGSVEIVDTTGRERVKLTSFHGGSYDMNQLGTTEHVNKRKTLYIKGDEFTTIKGGSNQIVDGDRDEIIRGNVYHKFGDVVEDSNIAKQIKELYTPIHEKQQLFDLQRTDASHPLDSSPLQTKSGRNAECPICSGKNKFLTRTTEKSKFTPARGINKEELDKGKSEVKEVSPSKDNCPNCGGSGVVPWSVEGNFDKDPRKTEIVNDINKTSEEMSRLESKMSSGGNVTSYITKSKTTFVGTELNDLGSIRLDPNGKRKIIGHIPTKDGKTVAPVYHSTPHIEHVATNNLAGGDYSLIAANRYSLFAGSNGVSIKTTGPLDIQGRIMTISGDQVNISSNNEVLIDGGKVLDLTADIINIRPRKNNVNGEEYKSVALESTISVASNMTTKGMAHIEGGVSTQHITAPLQYSETETTYSESDLKGGITIGKVVGNDVVSVPVRGFATSAHSHIFPTVASNLLDTNDDVRAYGNAAGGVEPVLAPAVVHSKSRNRLPQVPIRYSDPNLFALLDDCDDAYFNRLTDLISSSDKTPQEIREDIDEMLTRTSDVLDDNDCIPCN